MTTPSLRTLLALPLLCAAPGATPPSIPGSGATLVADAGRLLARGPGVSASFEAGEVLFAATDADPRGATALRWQFLSAARDGGALAFAASVAPAADASGLVRYERSAALEERYEPRALGIEQSFVFRALPEGEGDLVVRGRLESASELVHQDERDGLVFANGLRVGGVTGVDARGRTARGWLRLEGGVLALGLPADFVAQATLPLVLDPLIGSVVGPYQGGDHARGDVDVCRGEGKYLVVWVEEDEAPVAWSVVGLWLNADGSAASTVFDIWTNQGLEIHEVSVGRFLDPTFGTRFVVAWSRDTSAAGFREVAVRDFATLSTTVGTHRVLGNSVFNEVEPDVGASDEASATVVYRRVGAGLRGAEVGLTAGSSFVVQGEFDVTTDPDDRAPSIARVGGRRLVVWHREVTGTVVRSIMGRSWTGSAPSAAAFPIATGSLGFTSVDCAGASADDFFVAYDYGFLGSGGDHDVYGRRVSFPGGLPLIGAQVIVDSHPTLEVLDPRVAYSGNAYQVTYRAESGGGLWLIRSVSMDPLGGGALETPQTLQFAAFYNGHALAPVTTEAADLDRALSVWTVDDVYGQRFEGKGGQWEALDVGCPAGGGVPRVGALTSPNPGFAAELWYAEPFAGAYLAVSDNAFSFPLGMASIAFDPAATASYFVGPTNGAGQARIELPIPAGLSGAKAWIQWLVLTAGGTSCTGYPVLLSDGLALGVD